MDGTEVVVASSPVDAGISCWDLQSGAEHLRHRSCASPPHGLVCVADRFFASSQLRDSSSSSSSGSIFYWSWSKVFVSSLFLPSKPTPKPQVEVKSFPAEPIKPLAANREGTYIAGGGLSGDIYFWEVASGRLLKKWHAHYRAVTCLVFSDDESLLISGAEDGCVRVWSLFMIFDDLRREEAGHLYEHSFSEHTLRVTDIVTGYGGGNAIIVSASEDRTCKGKVEEDITRSIAYDLFRDGKIYIAALNAVGSSSNSYGMHIIGSLSDHSQARVCIGFNCALGSFPSSSNYSSKAVTCLAFATDGILLVSGSEDGMVRVWDTKTRNIFRIFKHAKGPVSNILVVRRPNDSNPRNSQTSSKKHGSFLSPPLDKYLNSSDENEDAKVFIGCQTTFSKSVDASYRSCHIIIDQIKELQFCDQKPLYKLVVVSFLQQQGSSAATEMEMERLKIDSQKSVQMVQQWKKMYENLHQFCVNELLDADHAGVSN
ncbi:Protein ROOT initiation defective 3 [Vitis vinifera]|uniref:Protein ROOT initiation defective 3 n=1 Tax=Vitis vinifera TaxID=29760 RepID=A0A438DYE4_VITVI|nr:Protein ROOT initiation defective 3 [Vitis vinifera]